MVRANVMIWASFITDSNRDLVNFIMDNLTGQRYWDHILRCTVIRPSPTGYSLRTSPLDRSPLDKSPTWTSPPSPLPPEMSLPPYPNDFYDMGGLDGLPGEISRGEMSRGTCPGEGV